MMFGGTILEIFHPAYAKTQLILVFATAAFQTLGRGWCPLTFLENAIWEKCAPERMYCDPKTYQASFIRHCLKKFLGINAPKGTTTGLLVLVLAVTILILLRWSILVPEIAVGIVLFYWFFSSKTWRKIAGNGPLNILPSYIVQWPLIAISSSITTIVVILLLCVLPERKRYPIARTILSKIYLFLATGRGVRKVGEIAKGQHVCASQHASHLDSAVVPLAMEKQFEDDPEMWKILSDPIMYWIIPFCPFLFTNGIKIYWTNIMRTGLALRTAIKKGYSVFLFPEGERSIGPDNQLLPCKQGAARMAKITGLNIQLILFHSPKRIAPKGWLNRPWFSMQDEPILIIYGIIIVTAGKEVTEIQKEIDEGFQAMLNHQLATEKQNG